MSEISVGNSAWRSYSQTVVLTTSARVQPEASTTADKFLSA